MEKILVTVTSLIVMLASVCAAIWYLTVASPVYQYPVALALLCFALATAGCLLLAAKVEIKGTLVGMSVFASGPAVAWIVAFLVVSHFPLPSSPTLVAPSGSVSFADWRLTVDSRVLKAFEINEDDELPGLLGNSYAPGLGHEKLANVKIVDMVYYFKEGEVILLRKMTGSQVANRAEIYDRPTSTTSEGSVIKASFIRSENAFKPLRDSMWHEVHGEIEYYAVVVYKDKLDADYIVTDVPKYVRQGSGLTVTQCIVSARQAMSVKAWEVQPAVVPAGETPLWFKEWSVSPETSLPGEVTAPLVDLARELDRMKEDSADPSAKVVAAAHEVMRGSSDSFEKLLAWRGGSVSCFLNGITRDSLLMSVVWDDS
jgi:hypothetical protein